MKKEEFYEKARKQICNKIPAECIHFNWSLKIKTSCWFKDDNMEKCKLLAGEDCSVYEATS